MSHPAPPGLPDHSMHMHGGNSLFTLYPPWPHPCRLQPWDEDGLASSSSAAGAGPGTPAGRSQGADLEQLLADAEHYYGQAYYRHLAIQGREAEEGAPPVLGPPDQVGTACTCGPRSPLRGCFNGSLMWLRVSYFFAGKIRAWYPYCPLSPCTQDCLRTRAPLRPPLRIS